MKKIERMIKENIDLEISMCYPMPQKRKRQVPFSYCAFIVILLFSFLIAIPKTSDSIQFQTKDSIHINYIPNYENMDIIGSISCMYEKNRNQNILKNIPFSYLIKNWTFEWSQGEYLISSKDKKVTITIKSKKSYLKEEQDFLEISYINQIPVKIIKDTNYQAWLEINNYIYCVRGNLAETQFIQLLKQLMGGNQ